MRQHAYTAPMGLPHPTGIVLYMLGANNGVAADTAGAGLSAKEAQQQRLVEHAQALEDLGVQLKCPVWCALDGAHKCCSRIATTNVLPDLSLTPRHLSIALFCFSCLHFVFKISCAYGY